MEMSKTLNLVGTSHRDLIKGEVAFLSYSGQSVAVNVKHKNKVVVWFYMYLKQK